MAQCCKTAPAHKGKKSCNYESICSKGASLGIRRDRETFSLRYSAGAHKASLRYAIAHQPTLLRRLSRNIRCMRRQGRNLIKTKAPAVQHSQGQIHLILAL